MQHGNAFEKWSQFNLKTYFCGVLKLIYGIKRTTSEIGNSRRET